MPDNQKESCIYYDESEKLPNDGLACQILKGSYYTLTGTQRRVKCTGRKCSFYKERKGTKTDEIIV